MSQPHPAEDGHRHLHADSQGLRHRRLDASGTLSRGRQLQAAIRHQDTGEAETRSSTKGQGQRRGDALHPGHAETRRDSRLSLQCHQRTGRIPSQGRRWHTMVRARRSRVQHPLHAHQERIHPRQQDRFRVDDQVEGHLGALQPHHGLSQQPARLRPGKPSGRQCHRRPVQSPGARRQGEAAFPPEIRPQVLPQHGGTHGRPKRGQSAHARIGRQAECRQVALLQASCATSAEGVLSHRAAQRRPQGQGPQPRSVEQCADTLRRIRASWQGQPDEGLRQRRQHADTPSLRPQCQEPRPSGIHRSHRQREGISLRPFGRPPIHLHRSQIDRQLRRASHPLRRSIRRSPLPHPAARLSSLADQGRGRGDLRQQQGLRRTQPVRRKYPTLLPQAPRR